MVVRLKEGVLNSSLGVTFEGLPQRREVAGTERCVGKSAVVISFIPALISRTSRTSWLLIAVAFARPSLPAP